MAKKPAPQIDPEDDDDDAPELRPQYRLTEPAYLADDCYVEAGAVIYFDQDPPHFMKPVNALAKAKCKALWPNGRPAYTDPIVSLSVGSGMKSDQSDTDRLVAAMAEQTAAINAMNKRKSA